MADPADHPKNLPAQVQEVWALVLAYARQETLDPIKGVGRYVAFGVLGSFALGIGVVLLLLGGLRALQTETDGTFAGNWSWAPYGITLAGAILLSVLALVARGRKRRST